MVTVEQERDLLRIAELRTGWGLGGEGRKVKPTVIRNARFMLDILNNPKIDIEPAMCGRIIQLTIQNPTDCILLNVLNTKGTFVINVHANKYELFVLDPDGYTLYRDEYRIRDFVDKYILK